MPQLRTYGNPHIGDADTQCVISVPTPPTAIAPIQVRRWVRNGKAPDSTFINRVREASNFAVLYRSKQVWGGIGYDGFNAPSSSTGGTAFRFACHTGPYTHAFYVKGIIYPPLNPSTQAGTIVKVYSDAAMTTLVSSLNLYYGAKPVGTGFGWRMARVMSGWIDGVAPDTDYYCSISSVDSGKVGGLAIFDMQSLSETAAGYLGTNLTVLSPIVVSDRTQPHDALKAVWKRGGSHILNWSTARLANPVSSSVDGNGFVGPDNYNTSISTTPVNLIDRSSTTFGTNVPMYYLDMTMKDRVGQNGLVPCVMKVWGFGAATPGDGTVTLVNSAGTTIATVTGFSTSSSPQWVGTTFLMPATLDRYALMYKSNTAGVRFYVGQVSIWEQE